MSSASTSMICPIFHTTPSMRWRSIPRRWASTRIATGFAWCRFRRATGPPTLSRSRRDRRRRRTLSPSCATAAITKLFHYGRFDHRRALPCLRRHGGAGVLHQDRLAADAHLYRPAWAEGHLRGTARDQPVQGAAVFRLGGRNADAGAARIRRFGCAPSAQAARRAVGRLAREDRTRMADACFRFLPTRARLDLMGWARRIFLPIAKQVPEKCVTVFRKKPAAKQEAKQAKRGRSHSTRQQPDFAPHPAWPSAARSVQGCHRARRNAPGRSAAVPHPSSAFTSFRHLLPQGEKVESRADVPANRQRSRLAQAQRQRSPFSPCGRRWPSAARSDEGYRRARRNAPGRSAAAPHPHPPSLRSGTFSHKGRR